MKHGVSLADTNIPVSRARGIFKHRLSKSPHNPVSMATANSSNMSVAESIINNGLFGGVNYSDDSGLEDSDSGSEDDWDDDLD